MASRISRACLTVLVAAALLHMAVPQPVAGAPPALTADVIVSGLVHPWDIAFAPDGKMLVTERPGRVLVYSGGTVGATLVHTESVPDVWTVGDGGVMGIAVDVDFASNRYVYVCASRSYTGSDGPKNEVLRYELASGGEMTGPTLILGGMKADTTHNGCALEMDRAGKLWVSMGDADPAPLNLPSVSQDRASLNGKVLRINRDGSVPSDNPTWGGVRNHAVSMGHRNPQGIAFEPGTGRVYVVEHGPNRDDEINLLDGRRNFGWPCVTGKDRAWVTGSGCTTAYADPAWASGQPTLATSGAAFVSGSQWGDWEGDLWVATLKWDDTNSTPGDPSSGHKLMRFGVSPSGALAAPVDYFDEVWGRLRAVVSGPGGQLYVSTSNGSDDKVVRISPEAPTVTRTYGTTSFGTAAAISEAEFPDLDADVMVATGANWPDALAGSAVAGRLGMPILLVSRDEIPAETSAELDRRNPARIWVVGGPSAVSESVRLSLEAYTTSGEVERVAGETRYDTAVAISQEWSSPGVQAVFVAKGTNFPDALAGAPAAALLGSPLLLVQPNDIPASTAAELDRLDPLRIYILGGQGAVSAAVAAELDSYTTGAVTRLSGSTRYATAAAISRMFWGRVPTTFVATGVAFQDALGGSAAAGRAGMPLLLSEPAAVPLPIGQELLRLGPTRVKMLGGPGALSAATEENLKALIGSP